MRDINGEWMQDICFAGRCLRVFWRGFDVRQRPYRFNLWGFYAFGAGPIGFMYWPKRRAA